MDLNLILILNLKRRSLHCAPEGIILLLLRDVAEKNPLSYKGEQGPTVSH